jgi:hypothetical protein
MVWCPFRARKQKQLNQKLRKALHLAILLLRLQRKK